MNRRTSGELRTSGRGRNSQMQLASGDNYGAC